MVKIVKAGILPAHKTGVPVIEAPVNKRTECTHYFILEAKITGTFCEISAPPGRFLTSPGDL